VHLTAELIEEKKTPKNKQNKKIGEANNNDPERRKRRR
jgi:hypothetical protein